MLKILPVKSSSGTYAEINENKYDITPCFQMLFTDQTYDTAKSMTDMEKIVFRDILLKTDYYNRKPTKGRLTGRDNYIKNDRDNDVMRIVNLDTKLKGTGF